MSVTDRAGSGSAVPAVGRARIAEVAARVRTRDLDPTEAVHIRHPFNPNSDVTLQRLGQRTGMERVAVTLARVPPGKESFIAHAHLLNEEFVYVLEGKGTAVIGAAAWRGRRPSGPRPRGPHRGARSARTHARSARRAGTPNGIRDAY